jgi:protein TonB
MSEWPSFDGGSEERALSDCWEGLSASAPEAADAPSVEVALPLPAGTPPLAGLLDEPPSSPVSAPPVRKFKPALMTLALIASTGLHAAIVAFLMTQLTRPGVEAETDAISVEIVLERPPQPTIAAADGAEAEVPHDPSPEGPGEAAPDAEPSSEPQIAPQKRPAGAEPESEMEPEETPGPEATTVPPHESPARRVEKPKPSSNDAAEEEAPSPEPEIAFVPPAPDPARSELLAAPPSILSEETPQPAEEALAEAVTPVTDAPIPTPRPAYEPTRKPVSKAKPKPKEVQAAEASPPRSKEKAAAQKRAGEKKTAAAEPAKRPAKAGGGRREKATAAGSASARGGGSAGEEARYARQLLSHVERHKRYPDAAARQRISGATRLAITITRSGGLAGARVTGSSGHGVLDEAALAAARRAAPYPRPPEGVGGGTFSFAVTMRFRR